MKADWSLNCGSYGGKVEEAGPDPVRRFPNDQGVKRGVRVILTTFPEWVGNGHYYTNIKEEDNPLWMPDRPDNELQPKGYWFIPWKDPEGNGRVFYGRWTNRVYAIRYVTMMLERHFPTDTYVVTDNLGEPWIESDLGPMPEPGEEANSGDEWHRTVEVVPLKEPQL